MSEPTRVGPAPEEVDHDALMKEIVEGPAPPAEVCPECGHGEPHTRMPSNFCYAVERDAGGSLVYCNCRRAFPPDDDLPATCKECGRVYKVDIQVPDGLWKQITDVPTTLCGICIMERVERLNRYQSFGLAINF